MKKAQMATADFVKAADALTNESFHGSVHLAICEGLVEMDAFIGSQAPVFFAYTISGHLSSAQMYANKLFDTHGNAVSILKFLDMADLRSSKFPGKSQRDLQGEIAEAKSVISKLQPAIKVLRQRRNDFLAHLSPKVAFTPELLQHTAKVNLPQIKEVLLEGGKIVNRFLIMWNGSSNFWGGTHVDDYKKVISWASKQLCAEIQAHEAEFAKYGVSQRLLRPKDCP